MHIKDIRNVGDLWGTLNLRNNYTNLHNCLCSLPRYPRLAMNKGMHLSTIVQLN